MSQWTSTNLCPSLSLIRRTTRSLYDVAPLTLRTSIRLLEFAPTSSPADARSHSLICCKLYTSDLATCPRYVALSYMWGNSEATELILINGQVFLVRKNLWNFLNRARDEQAPYCGPLWIDAICINQQNVLERNHQVALMGEIYTKTQLVISWFGVKDEEWVEGLDYMLKVKRGEVDEKPGVVRHDAGQLEGPL